MSERLGSCSSKPTYCSAKVRIASGVTLALWESRCMVRSSFNGAKARVRRACSWCDDMVPTIRTKSEEDRVVRDSTHKIKI